MHWKFYKQPISFDTEKENHMKRSGIHNKVMIITNNNIFLLKKRNLTSQVLHAISFWQAVTQ